MRKKFLDNNIIGIDTGVLPSKRPAGRNRPDFYSRKKGIFDQTRDTIFSDGTIPTPRTYPALTTQTLAPRPATTNPPPPVFTGFRGGAFSGAVWDGSAIRIVTSFSRFSPDRNVVHSFGFDPDGNPEYLGNFGLTSDNLYPSGITWDGQFLRVIDRGRESNVVNRIFSYTPQGVHVPNQDIELPPRSTSSGVRQITNTNGITWDGTAFFITGQLRTGTSSPPNDAYIFKYEPGSSDYFISASIPGAGIGQSVRRTLTGIVWDSDRDVIYVVDSVIHEVYAYEFSSSSRTSLNRNSNLGFSLAFANRGEDALLIIPSVPYIYVFDETDEKLYAYEPAVGYAPSADINFVRG